MYVLSACVLVVTSNPYICLSDLRDLVGLVATAPLTWAAASLNSIGGSSVVVPYWAHQIQAALLGLVPAVLWNKYKYGFGVGIRKRGMKKEEDAKSK